MDHKKEISRSTIGFRVKARPVSSTLTDVAFFGNLNVNIA